MKVHLIGESAGSCNEALESWEYNGLIPYKTKACTGFMMKKGNENFFTSDIDEVTCGLCKRIIKKAVRKANK